MKLTITFTNKSMSLDFQMNSEMEIKEALKIISKNSIFKINDDVVYIFSKRKNQKINVHYSFQQAGIYSGDELIVEDTNNEY